MPGKFSSGSSVTKTQNLFSKQRGAITVSTTFTGMGAGATCTVAVKARQTDYDNFGYDKDDKGRQYEFMQVRHGNIALNANCGFTKQCNRHTISSCKLATSSIKADSNGVVVIKAVHGRYTDYCPYNGYYMWAQATVS